MSENIVVEQEIQKLTNLVQDEKLRLRLEKTIDHLKRYYVIKKEVDFLVNENFLLKEKRNNLSQAVANLEESKDKLTLEVRDKEISLTRLSMETEKENRKLDGIIDDQNQAERACVSREEQSRAVVNNLTQEANDIKGSITSLEDQKKSSFMETERAIQTMKEKQSNLVSLEQKLSDLNREISSAENTLSFIKEEIAKGEKKIKEIEKEKEAIKLQNENYKETLRSEIKKDSDRRVEEQKEIEKERNRRWMELSKREEEIDNKIELNKRYDEILGKKAQDLRTVKRKLEEFHGKPINVKI